jgi:hypothetical protein
MVRLLTAALVHVYCCFTPHPCAPCLPVLCLQGIDTASAEPQLIYACAGMAVPETVKPTQSSKAKRSARNKRAAAAPGQAAAPGETLNGVNPTDADPAIGNVWTLSSRPEATKKIW